MSFNQKEEVIVESIFEIWIAIFGSPKTCLVDNGGEFNNSEFISFCENLDINMKTTAAESPWSNGLVERHNGVLGNTIRKIMSDTSNYSSQELPEECVWIFSKSTSLWKKIQLT